MPTTVENFENSFGNRLFRRPNGTVHEDSDDDSAIHEKSPLRPTGTFERLKIEFRSEEGPVLYKKNSKGAANRSGNPVSYASRADRRSLMLTGVAIISLVLVAGFMQFGPGSKYYIRQALNQMPIQSEAVADDGVVNTESLDMKMKEVRKAQVQQSAVDGTSEGDTQELQISTKDQQASMDEKLNQAESQKQQDQEDSSSDTDSPSWREPAKFSAVGLPTRIYDTMAHAEAGVNPSQDPISVK